MTTPPTSPFRCDIAVVGESLIDTVVAADGTRRERVGGGPAGLARGLGRLGIATTLLTTFGTDPHGRAIDHELTRCGVRVIQAGHPATRTSTTITGPTDPAQTPSTSAGNSPTPTSRPVLTCTSAPRRRAGARRRGRGTTRRTPGPGHDHQLRRRCQALGDGPAGHRDRPHRQDALPQRHRQAERRGPGVAAAGRAPR
ncbi:hypothetical protein FXW78_51270 [Rhodococcus opacus]|nr:hypothetical protein [Rhodococcus opacus]